MRNFYLSRAHWSLESGQAVIKGTQNADHGIRDALTLPHTFPHKLCPGSQRLDFARHPHFQTTLSSSPLPPFCSSVAQCHQYNHPLSVSVYFRKRSNHIPSLSDARTLARPPTLSSPAPKLCFTFVRSRPTLSSKTKEKKGIASLSDCCSQSQCYYYRKTTIGLLWSEHDWRVRGISSKFNF